MCGAPLEVLGQILTGIGDLPGHVRRVPTLLARSVHGSEVVCESRSLSSIGHVTAGLALAALIDKFDPPVGPGDDDEPPTWGSVEIGDERLAPPSMLAAFFDAGQLAPVPVVVRICDSSIVSPTTSRILVYTAPADRAHAAQVLDAIMDDAEGAMSLFRGRALAASERTRADA